MPNPQAFHNTKVILLSGKALSGQTVLLGQNCENAGGVDIWLDEIVPCLKDTQTGEIEETVVFKMESRSFLKKFMEKDGWGINWIELPSDVEVYALALRENNEIQGLVGVKNDVDVEAAYLHWACSAPHICP